MGLFGRTNRVVQALPDGTFAVILPAEVRAAIDDVMGQVEDLLDDPDSPLVARLQPPAYPDDPDRDLAYQLLAGEELRTARREAIAVVRRVHEQETATEEDLWSWLRAMNALRLVLGTALGITDDEDEEPDLDDDDPALPLWGMDGLTAQILYDRVDAVGG